MKKRATEKFIKDSINDIERVSNGVKKDKLFELPKGWVWTKLEEVCLYTQYGWTTSARTKGSLHLLRTTDITSGNIDWNIVPFCEKEPSEKEKYLLKDGDIVISRAGSVGYSHLIKNPKEAVFASYLIRFRPMIDEKYLAYFLKSPFYWNSISEKSLGIAIPNVNASKLKQIFIPLPPLPEQRAIVSKLEQLFSSLDNGIENFKKAQAQLKLYRQAVLKYACEGKLVPTEAELARIEGREYETADVLLERILKERREKWTGRRKYKEPDSPDISELSELPEGWRWVSLEELSEINPKLPNNDFVDDFEVSFLPMRVVEEQTGKFDLAIIKKYVEVKKGYTPFINGDIIFAKITPCMENGKIAVVENLKNGVGFGSTEFHVIRLVNNISKSYIFNFIVQEKFRKDAQRYMTGSAGQLRVSANYLQKTLIPLPPLAEQHRIVTEVERRLSVCDKMEETITDTLTKAESLRQSILKKAFEGKLLNEKELEETKNAPDWEPAEKLLERIRQEKRKDKLHIS